MEELTIKELADQIGVSKTAINKKVTEEMKEKYFYKVGNRFLINEPGQNIIKSMFIDYLAEDEKKKMESETSETESGITETDSEKTQIDSKTLESESQKTQIDSFANNNLSETAMKILENYQDQLTEKDRQMAELHKIIDQQQQLTLHTNQQNDRLRIQINSYEEEELESEPVNNKVEANYQDDNDSKKWWKFWSN